VSGVLRADHSSQAFPCRHEFVLELSHTAISNALLGAAGVPLRDETPVDSFEIGDSGDELGALRAVDLRTELESQPLLQLVVLGSQALYLLTRKNKVDLQSARCGVGLPSRDRDGLATPGRLDVLPNAFGVDQPGRHTRCPRHGWERDRLTGCFEDDKGVKGTSPFVSAVVGPGGCETSCAT